MKKIKKLLTISLSGLLALGAFTGCDLLKKFIDTTHSASSSCEHTYKWVVYEEGHQQAYTCGCSYPDILQLHSDVDKNAYCDICEYYVGVEQSIDPIYPDIFFDFIKKLEKMDIQKIETVEYPGSASLEFCKPIEHKTSTLDLDIETIYNWLKGLQGTLTKLSNEEAHAPGAGNKIFTIYLSQSHLTIDVTQNYLNVDGVFYKYEGQTPEILGETVTYKFVSYHDKSDLYINDEKVKDYTFDFAQLVCEKKDFETSSNPHKLVTNIGELYLYDEKHFVRNDIPYEIVGTLDFSQIFEEFPINSENDLLYKVTIVDKNNYFFDKPTEEYFEAGTIITLYCYPFMDVNLVMYINGERVGIQQNAKDSNGNYIWKYSFVVPTQDITVTFKTSGGM